MALTIERGRRNINPVHLGVQQRFDINAVEENSIREESHVCPDCFGPAHAVDDFGVHQGLADQWRKIDMPLLGTRREGDIIS